MRKFYLNQDSAARIKEYEILKKDEEGELFRRLDFDIRDIVLSNNNVFIQICMTTMNTG